MPSSPKAKGGKGGLGMRPHQVNWSLPAVWYGVVVGDGDWRGRANVGAPRENMIYETRRFRGCGSEEPGKQRGRTGFMRLEGQGKMGRVSAVDMQ